MEYVHNGISLSHKKEENIAMCSNMDGPRDYHTKWSKSDRERQIYIAYMWNLKKNDTNKLIYRKKNKLTEVENKLMITKGENGDGII